MIRTRLALALSLALGWILAAVQPVHADTIRGQQWYLNALRVPTAQQISQGEGVTVAVIDTGVQADQADLTGSVLDGFDTGPGGGNGQQDEDGHGTAIAAIIAGHGHGAGNSDGILGIAPRAKILPIKVVRGKATNQLTSETVVAAIDAAIARGAKVINASITAQVTGAVEQAVLRALDHDVVFVASAGNTGTTTDILGTRNNKVEAPAVFRGVLAICGTDRSGNHAAVSLTAPADRTVKFAVCAPAVDGVRANPDGSYTGGANGTSMSSAIVAGVAALIRAKNPTMPAYEVAHRITATATPKGDVRLYGQGLVDPVAALTNNVPATPSPTQWVSRSPAPSATSPSGGSPSSAASPAPSVTSWPTLVAITAAVVIALGISALFLVRRKRRR